MWSFPHIVIFSSSMLKVWEPHEAFKWIVFKSQGSALWKCTLEDFKDFDVFCIRRFINFSIVLICLFFILCFEELFRDRSKHHIQVEQNSMHGLHGLTSDFKFSYTYGKIGLLDHWQWHLTYFTYFCGFFPYNACTKERFLLWNYYNSGISSYERKLKEIVGFLLFWIVVFLLLFLFFWCLFICLIVYLFFVCFKN